MRSLGKVEIERVSDIKWAPALQLWYIEIISGPLEGKIIGGYYEEYEDATAAEIEILDELRRRGIF